VRLVVKISAAAAQLDIAWLVVGSAASENGPEAPAHE
jgi:hypothetical protein